MATATTDMPATLQVLRYDPQRCTLETLVGDGPSVPVNILVEHAVAALQGDSFICHTRHDDALLNVDEICFIPRGGRCEIVSIHTNGWRRHHGDHRRSLVEILNDLTAAVARGTLSFLDDGELEALAAEGFEIFACAIDDTASVGRARSAVTDVLRIHHVGEDTRRRMQLCVSEATTNMLVHGGGGGTMHLRFVDGRLRAILADRGPGMNFINWTIDSDAGQPSMGYGYKIILDNLERVFLHTGAEGTTLVLDRSI